MGAQSIASQTSELTSFRNFSLGEVPWWMLCCRVYERSFAWRQIPAQVRLADVQAAQGQRPEAPILPPEPLFTGTRSQIESFQDEHQDWDRRRQELVLEHQRRVLDWETRGAWLSQRWELCPVPDLAPFDARPPEHREWVPVQVMEGEGSRASRTRRIPMTARNWREERAGHWKESLIQGRAWKPYTTSELHHMLGDEAYIHLPQTLVLVVPGVDFRRFLRQAEGEALSLVRCRWDPQMGRTVQVGRVPLTFIQPAIEIVTSISIEEPGCIPITDWEGVPASVEYLEAWEKGQRVPVTRAQFGALERWVSDQPRLPEWYMDPEYRSMAALNLCCSEEQEHWGEGFLWRPLLEIETESEDSDWVPSL